MTSVMTPPTAYPDLTNDQIAAAGPVPPAEPVRRSRWSRVVRGRDDDPAWARPMLLALLGATGLLYLWDLGASGWANAYYSAAAQAGSQSWTAFFFGSLDSSNSITVDKTPASLWVMDLSARIFGLSSWSLLVPQALMGVGAVWLLVATVRRVSTPAAALLAGAVMATTPVAALMFRFNNPDALLVLLLVGSAYATLRAVERASTRWLVLAAAFVGFGFLTKMLQALLVVPALAAVYLVAAPTPLRRRIWQLILAGGALVATAGWWVAIVELMPASARPYIGGSQTNSVLELMLGYNGLGRLTGDETGSVGGGGGGWGETGWLRLVNAEIGGQIAWLLPAALVSLGVLLWVRGRAGRSDLARASALLWGGWLVVTALVFSFMAGIFHAYYTVALAPAIAALVGCGAAALWSVRASWVARSVLAVMVAGTSWWAAVLLARSPDWLPWLRPLVIIAGFLGAALILLDSLLPRGLQGLVAGLAIASALASPIAASVATAATPHTGAIPSASPAVTVGGGLGAGLGRMQFGGPNGAPGGFAGAAPGGPPPTGARFGGQPGQGAGPGQTMTGGGGGLGGLLDASTPSAELTALLTEDASSYRWIAAAVGANNAAGIQLATELPVMAIGGFNGSDPSPTLAEFQALVAAGDIHWFLGGGGLGPQADGGSSASTSIAAWVASTFEATTVDGTTVYDLSGGGQTVGVA